MYVDTCMAVKLYLPEAQIECVQRRVSCEPMLQASALLGVELASVLARKCRAGELEPEDQRRVQTLFQRHVSQGYWKLIPLTDEDITAAGELIRACQKTVGVRALDALHLSVCRAYRVYPLFTTDSVMLTAAHFLGIPVETV